MPYDYFGRINSGGSYEGMGFDTSVDNSMVIHFDKANALHYVTAFGSYDCHHDPPQKLSFRGYGQRHSLWYDCEPLFTELLSVLVVRVKTVFLKYKIISNSSDGV